ncbi:MAG: DUF2169 domain-containing protein, partial [Desulfatitalea sp.]|nr:DUF2169 domain-containing protein [Desulfatitalea sp.]
AKCFAPEGKPRTAAQVSFRVGPIAKRLDVFGPRFWERRAAGMAISDPQPFTVVDLDWPNAFGGPGFDSNPLGRGIDPVATATGMQVLPLPAVEDPAHLIGAPGDRPSPAGFMPIDQTWPQRNKKAGTYDQKWFQAHWPFFPEDMNWTFFNTAPEDQQQGAWFQGGETVELTNMHPRRQLLQAVLPRLRQRVFVNQFNNLQAPEKGLSFREAQTRLDTVWLFPHALRGVLVHRAVLEVADEEAVDVKHLYLVTESADDAPQSLEHYLAALEKRLDRTVQVDMSQLDAAMAQAGQEMKKIKDIPKALAHSLAVAQGKVPNAGISPQNAAARCVSVLGQSQERMQTAEKQLLELKQQFGHMVKIDLAPLASARDKFEQLKGTIGQQMAKAEAITQKASAAKQQMQDKVLKALDRPASQQLLAKAKEQMAPKEKALWPEQALALVRQGRYDLSLDPVRMSSLRKMGLRPVTLKRAMVAAIAQDLPFVPEQWGLDPAPSATLPAGLVLAVHNGSRITRLVIRPGDLASAAADVTVPGSTDTAFGAALAPGKPVVIVADPLEAWLVEQDAGDWVGVAALPTPDTAPDKETADLLKEAPRLLVVIYSRDPAARNKAIEAWRSVYPQAEALPLPERAAIFDAHQQSVSLEDWIVAALGPDQAPFVPEDSPFRAKDGPDAAGLSIPSLDAKGLYQGFHDGMMEKMAPIQERSAALKHSMTEKMDAAIEKARAQMRRDGLEKHGIDPQKCFIAPPPAQKSAGFMAGMDLSAKYGHVRQSLAKAGQMTPERAAALDVQEAKMSKVLADAKARWAEGQAKLPGAGGGFAFPDWAKKMLAPFHIDPDDREIMTRETVIDRHANRISLKGKNLSGLDLSGLDLTGADLRGAQMKKTSFAGSKLDGADLSGTIAEQADFTGASFNNGKAVQAIMSEAGFGGAALAGTDFSKALLKGADLANADLSNSTLEQTLLEEAQLTGANLSGVKAAKGYFMGADLTGAKFSNAEAAKAVFHRATAAKTDFSGSDLTRAIFWDARADQANFQGSKLENARFGGTASVKQGNFRDTDLTRASMIDADLSDGDFKGARFERSFLRNCNLSRSDLSGVSAKRTFFHRTNLEGANLSHTNLLMGSLRKARLVNADLSGANLYGAELYRTVVGNTNFEETNLKMTLLNKRVELLDDQK